MPSKKHQEKKVNNPNTSSATDGLFDILHSNNLLHNAQKVVSSAVNVLEAEIAAGILAAKKIERKVLDFDHVDTNPENLMNRIRRDTHEGLDIFLDAFASLSKQIGILTETLNKANDKHQNPTEHADQNSNITIQYIEHGGIARAGESVTMHLSLRDNDLRLPLPIHIEMTDFIAGPKQKIASRFIKLLPADILLKPNAELEVGIHIHIPKNCTSAIYYSLLTISEIPHKPIVLSLEVIS